MLPRRTIDFRAYAGIKMWNELAASTKSKLHLFNDRGNDYHIVYLFDNLLEKLHHMRPIPGDSRLSSLLQSKKTEDKKLIERAQRQLSGVFIKALDFVQAESVLSPLCYPGNVIPGFVIQGEKSDSDYMDNGSYFGIGVSYKVVEELIYAIQRKSYQDLDNISKALEHRFVHEIVHSLQVESDQKSSNEAPVNKREIGPFAVEFIHNSLQEGELDTNFILPFDFSSNLSQYEKSIPLALKVLYKELSEALSRPSHLNSALSPKSYKPDELSKAMKACNLFHYQTGEVLDEIKQKIIDTPPQELLESANKVPNLQTTKPISKLPFEDGEIEVICDELMVSKAIVTLTNNAGKIQRNIRINSDIAEALADKAAVVTGADPSNIILHQDAKKVLEFALALAKKKPINLLDDKGTKINIFEYGAKRIQAKLQTELEVKKIENSQSNIEKANLRELEELKFYIDRYIKEGDFQRVCNLAKLEGQFNSLDETLIVWDHTSDSPIQRTYVDLVYIPRVVSPYSKSSPLQVLD